MAKGKILEGQASKEAVAGTIRASSVGVAKRRDLDIKTGCFPVRSSASLLDISYSSSLSYLLVVFTHTETQTHIHTSQVPGGSKPCGRDRGLRP